jgi:NitT/TauT family transport system ATP-binding protein
MIEAASLLVPSSTQAVASASEQYRVVELLSAGKVYSNGARALAPIDLVVRGREFVTLIGPSGCGKSTLLRMVAGLARPSEGRMLWWNEGFDALGTAGRRLSFVFQDPTLMPWSSVAANVRLPLDLANLDRREADKRVGEALELVGLSRFERHLPRQLSGGMQMRVSIARALVNDPNLLLMDEPFGALDEITRNRLDAELIDLWWKRGLTVVFVTHSVYEAVFLSTRVVIMGEQPGRVLREVAIAEPHPRRSGFRDTEAFVACCKEVSRFLAECGSTGTGEFA